jgi:ribose 5-phosphate isomerase A
MNLKEMAARRAVEQVSSGVRLGLGTGSTVQFVLDALAERLREGSLSDIVGVPTSKATEERCHTLGIPLASLETCPALDLTIDGADEISPELNLIKGLGGALLREKVVAAASSRLLIVADASKRVDMLGTKAPLPVEVVPFGWFPTMAFFEQLGATPTLRRGEDNQPYMTDNGNMIVDCPFAEGIANPHTLAQLLDAHPAVMGHGLFLGMAAGAIVGTPDGVVELNR